MTRLLDVGTAIWAAAKAVRTSTCADPLRLPEQKARVPMSADRRVGRIEGQVGAVGGLEAQFVGAGLDVGRSLGLAATEVDVVRVVGQCRFWVRRSRRRR